MKYRKILNIRPGPISEKCFFYWAYNQVDLYLGGLKSKMSFLLELK